jgi:glycosyltransferase involved in cell wall biosynthesis
LNPEYSIVIPAYNEARRITATLEKVLAYVAGQGWAAEVVVVNDGSRDETAAIVSGFAARNPAVRLVENPGNHGKGFSVRNGMMQARGQWLLFTDADLSSPIEEAPKLVDALRAGADVAIGSRWLERQSQTKRQPLYRQIIGRVFNGLLQGILRLPYKDTQCGFKAFTHAAAQELFSRQLVDRWAFDPELLFLARKLRMKVEEVPVAWAHDKLSTIRPFRDGPRMFWELLLVRWYAATGRYHLKG